MKRINTPRAANTYQGAAGGTGHFQDTDPAGGTQFDAMWCEGMQEAVAATIEGLGGTLSGTETGQLWGLLQPRVDGIFAHATDTGTYTNALLRVVVASNSGRATGASSIAAACGGAAWASGDGSVVIACNGGEASGTPSAAIACINSFVGGVGTSMIGAKNTECVDTYTRAIGYKASPAITKTSANQNMLGYEDATTGEYRAQIIKVGGNANTRTGETITLTGSTGIAAGTTATFTNIGLTTEKTQVKHVSISSGVRVEAVSPWAFVAAIGGNGPGWKPVDNGGTNDLYFYLDGCTVGRKIVKATVTVEMDAGDTGTVTGELFKRPAGGAAVTLLAAPVTWTSVPQGAKDLTPAADVTVTDTDAYFIKLSVTTGATFPITPEACGVTNIVWTEKFQSLG